MARNRETQRIYVAGHYQRNKALYKRRAVLSKRVARKRNKDFVDAYKLAKGCCRCGFREHPAAIDFHHVNRSEKDENVAILAKSGVSLDRLRNEIAKCLIACANCHRMTTAGAVKLVE